MLEMKIAPKVAGSKAHPSLYCSQRSPEGSEVGKDGRSFIWEYLC